MTVLAFSIFLILYLVAIAGIIIPVLPGIPIAALGAFIAAWLQGFEKLTASTLILVMALTILAVVLDYLASAIGAKKFGASRAGVWGSVIGSLVGLFFFPPFGFLIGALLGAALFELLIKRPVDDAVRSGFGALMGTLGGIAIKFVVVIAIGIVVFPKLLGA